ncbi:PQQ-binding-like beta-propeller repeat protein [Streptomyces sp. NPDC051956]|uniref:outer membrane protein assembly factor BamB family protein n=1 Tax=Streptomyces sp. NPDC051956 TaxID=3365677 RepID=UPI0037D12AC8
MNPHHDAKQQAKALSRVNGRPYATNLAHVLRSGHSDAPMRPASDVSPYATGGGGTVLEHRYGAVLLSHLLTQTPVPALGDHISPTHIRFQARGISKVDDILVRGRGPTDAEHFLSIGVRRQPRLVPSEAESIHLIGAYLDVVTTRWPALESGRWRLALAVASSCIPAHQVGSLASIAAAAGSPAAFRARMAEPGYTNAKVRNRLEQLDSMVCTALASRGSESSAAAAPDVLTWRMLSRLSLIELRLEGADLADRTGAVERLQKFTPHQHPSEADALFSRLAEEVGAYAPGGAEVDLRVLHASLHGLACFALPATTPPAVDPAALNTGSTPCAGRGGGTSRPSMKRLRGNDLDPQPWLWRKRTLSDTARQPQLCADTIVVRDGYWLLVFDAATGEGLWKKQTAYSSDPVLGAHTVFIADRAGYVLPRSLRTGAKRQSLPIRMVDGLAVVDRGTLYAAGPDGHLHAVDIASRVVLWTLPLVGQPIAPPQVLADSLFVQTGPLPDDSGVAAADRLWALNTEGSVRWVHAAQAGQLRYWIVGTYAVYIVYQPSPGSSRVVALDVGSGDLLWDRQVRGDLAAAPREFGHALYLTTAEGDVAALDARTGTLAWTQSVGRRVTAPPLVTDGAVFVSAWQPCRLAVFDARNGARLWFRKKEGAFASAPFAAGGIVYAGHRAGVLHAWDMRTRKEVWHTDLQWSESLQGAPLVAGGVLYVTTSSGDIRAYALLR